MSTLKRTDDLLHETNIVKLCGTGSLIFANELNSIVDALLPEVCDLTAGGNKMIVCKWCGPNWNGITCMNMCQFEIGVKANTVWCVTVSVYEDLFDISNELLQTYIRKKFLQFRLFSCNLLRKLRFICNRICSFHLHKISFSRTI